MQKLDNAPMHLLKAAIACVLIAVTNAVVSGQPEKETPILTTFVGQIANDEKLDLATMFIANGKDWKNVWSKVERNEVLPVVDFTTHFLLISTIDAADPNVQTPEAFLDDKGVVRLTQVTTLMAFKPSDETLYQFHLVARFGVTGVRRYDPVRGEEVVHPLPKVKNLPIWFMFR